VVVNFKAFNPVQFSSYAVVDVGASKKYLGNMRIELRAENDTLIKRFDGTTVVEKPFTTADDFERGFANRLREAFLDQSFVLKNDRIDAVVGVIPGSVYKINDKFVVSSVGNLQTHSGERLTNINMDNVVNNLNEPNVADLISQPVKQVFANDMAGGAAYIGNKLFADPTMREKYQIKDGEQLFLVMTGGGMGVCQIAHHPATTNFTPEFIEIKPTEKGHVVQRADGQGLEYNGASVHALVNNFTQILSILGVQLGDTQTSVASFREKLQNPDNPDKQFEKEIGNSKIVTSYEEALRVFPGLPEKAYKDAANKAINKYIDGLAFFIATEMLAFNSKTVLTGLVVAGVNNFLKKPENLLGQLASDAKQLNQPKDQNLRILLQNQNDDDVLAKMLIKRVWQKYSNPHGKGALLGMNAIAPFKIITDIELNSNADGGPILRHAVVNGLMGSPNRIIFKPDPRFNDL